MPLTMFEIYGLYVNTQGYSCSLHPACGMAILAGDLVYVYREWLVVDSHLEDAGTIYRVVNGAISCKVRYVPRLLSVSGLLNKIIDKYAKKKKIYPLSSNLYKVCINIEKYSMASCVVIDHVTTNLM